MHYIVELADGEENLILGREAVYETVIPSKIFVISVFKSLLRTKRVSEEIINPFFSVVLVSINLRYQ